MLLYAETSAAGQEPDCFKISQNAAVPCKSQSLRPCVKKRKKRHDVVACHGSLQNFLVPQVPFHS